MERGERLRQFASEVIRTTRDSLIMRHRFMARPFYQLTERISCVGNIPWGTDGRGIMCSPEGLLREYLEDVGTVELKLLHTTMHCLYVHPFFIGTHVPRLWDIAADIYVWNVLRQYFPEECGSMSGGREAEQKREELFGLLCTDAEAVSAQAIYRVMKRAARGEMLHDVPVPVWEEAFRVDDHTAWYAQGSQEHDVSGSSRKDGAGTRHGPDAPEEGTSGERDKSEEGTSGERDKPEEGTSGEKDIPEGGTGGERDESGQGTGGERDMSGQGASGEREVSGQGTSGERDESGQGTGGERDMSGQGVSQPDEATESSEANPRGVSQTSGTSSSDSAPATSTPSIISASQPNGSCSSDSAPATSTPSIISASQPGGSCSSDSAPAASTPSIISASQPGGSCSSDSAPAASTPSIISALQPGGTGGSDSYDEGMQSQGRAGADKAGADIAGLAERWKEQAGYLEMELLAEAVRQNERQGKDPGHLAETLSGIRRQGYSYTEFLRKFAIIDERMEVSPDEFDFIYYSYGLSLYGDTPLIEPLEYREMHTIREFVIAIDTSGSCDRDLVRKFLQKTWDILWDEAIFSDQRMEVHILQCDAQVQEHMVISDRHEAEKYLKEFQILGRGGTDFRPVFSYVEKLRREGSLSHIQGLLYFTDGYGSFPSRPANYKTAFVFAERDSNVDVPPWAMKIYIEEERL